MTDPAIPQDRRAESEDAAEGSQPSPVMRSRAIDAEPSPGEVDVGALVQRIALRLDEVLDGDPEPKRREHAAARREEAVQAWTDAIAQGADGEALAARRRAFTATVHGSGDVGFIGPSEVPLPTAPEEEAAAEPEQESGQEIGHESGLENGHEVGRQPGPEADPPTSATPRPDVSQTDAKLQTVRRRLEGRRVLSHRPPEPRPSIWRRWNLASWVQPVLWGTVIVALSVVVSLLVL